MVEVMLLERGIAVSYETIRCWAMNFGPDYAGRLRRKAPSANDVWHLDEVVVMIGRRKHWLWRAVDQDGYVLDEIVQTRRNTKATSRLLGTVMKNMQAICALTIMFPAFLATPAPMRALNAETLPLIAYPGGLASVVLLFLWIRGVHILGPNPCAVFMNLLPVLTAAGAIILLGESVRSYHVLGGAVALAGLACAESYSRPLRGAPPAMPDIVERAGEDPAIQRCCRSVSSKPRLAASRRLG